ncbi:putative lumazine-binding protein [Dysgonomonas alginatilytica]|uniref:Putative lumazine-binding protein n=1 Tax=Dysgonomonas alginatilytica TaxID=1605892 RepID=A0A2V3PTS2_9BACT|nr:nuclear transport factor 2 family protein [Dysgonomonas alginatilytica]PXV67982.1 putative lumazine-binding protein [Dysgonomonas alginatilytica]
MMIKKIFLLAAFVMIILPSIASQENEKVNNMEEQQIKELLEEKYINAVANKLDTDKMLELFHPDFAIFSADGEELKRFPLLEWKKAVDDYKKDNKGNPGLRTLTYDFASIDVTGNAAAVKVLLFRNKELIATDYISLLKFNGVWKIVAKVPYAHVDKPF